MLLTQYNKLLDEHTKLQKDYKERSRFEAIDKQFRLKKEQHFMDWAIGAVQERWPTGATTPEESDKYVLAIATLIACGGDRFGGMKTILKNFPSLENDQKESIKELADKIFAGFKQVEAAAAEEVRGAINPPRKEKKKPRKSPSKPQNPSPEEAARASEKMKEYGMRGGGKSIRRSKRRSSRRRSVRRNSRKRHSRKRNSRKRHSRRRSKKR